MGKTKKILVVTGTRAEYGILKPVLDGIKKNKNFKLFLVATGMHLSREFGYTIKGIKKDNFKIDAKVDLLLKDNTGARMARSIGVGAIKFTRVFETLKPDIILVLGDREEIFAAAIAGLCLNISIAHLGGGDVGTGGHIDESIRHSITKFAHLHFPFSQKSAGRILKLGEEKWRIFTTGSPAVDNILHQKMINAKDISAEFSLDLSKPIILLVQHPLSIQPRDSGKQMEETMAAIKELKIQTVLIYPNADAGSKDIIKVINKYKKHPFIKIFKNIPTAKYLSLMKVTNVIVGNSSSGILEAPSFGLPAVNIGLRQDGRERARNVIDVQYNKSDIKRAINKAIYDVKFIKKVKKCKSPFGTGNAAKKIVEILGEIEISPKLLHKKITY